MLISAKSRIVAVSWSYRGDAWPHRNCKRALNGCADSVAVAAWRASRLLQLNGDQYEIALPSPPASSSSACPPLNGER
jgi:hypothetical protein